MLFVIIIAGICCSFSAAKIPSGSGITFFKGTYSQALAASAKTKKPLFVDVYATWCGPCKQLKRESFKDKAVGEYFNKNFVCFSIDGETEEGRILRKVYNIDSYPTLLITDATGKQLARTEGFMKPYILINFRRRVVPQ
ncbi:thioredoxin family protein [Flavobacterium sp. 3HN19-14]|uniref:thioredoxin family protein n=1 Tax=Flavobacterium sp. 3HN19-14 TaxID=3448133 RepID=UPI003EE002A6